MSLLEIEEITVSYTGFIACEKISLQVNTGEIVGIMGQSGSGKSSLARAILHLHDEATVEYKQLRFGGLDFSKLALKQRKQLLQNIAWIPQDPSTALCEHLTIQTQLLEQMRFVQKIKKRQAKKTAIEMMNIVGIDQPELRLKQYPHQLSGGIKQRVLIAMALCQNPKLIIADELTASLDTYNKANLAKLILQIQKKLNVAFFIISHDVNFIQTICSKVYVMFASQVVESQNAKDFFQNPKHPYSQDLINATPSITKPGERIVIKPCSSRGCKYLLTCKFKQTQCSKHSPNLYDVKQAKVRCYLYDNMEIRDGASSFKKSK